MSSLRNLLASVLVFAIVLQGSIPSQAQLSPNFYDQTCPGVQYIIFGVLVDAFRTDIRIGASLIRLHFHDCFVQGCDASLLLDNSATILSEKESLANNNSARGFDVVDRMKAALEIFCPGVVSCADILTIAAEQSVFLSGRSFMDKSVGKKRTAEQQTEVLPIKTFLHHLHLFLTSSKSSVNVGLNGGVDLVALSGAHTFGRAQCRTFSRRLFNFNSTGSPDPTLNTTLLTALQELCPQGGNGSVLTNLDLTTPDTFDNKYFTNLQIHKGLLISDQELFSTPGADYHCHR
ncbi:Peroxidase [Melia azedarach]|uniref:Peroxidase n=1 Tax=Melia azedarach TaxID=155640 RepID=A0ACC1YM32_MELAZ|nr:Peroxidase [Melia azedarach]